MLGSERHLLVDVAFAVIPPVNHYVSRLVPFPRGEGYGVAEETVGPHLGDKVLHRGLDLLEMDHVKRVALLHLDHLLVELNQLG